MGRGARPITPHTVLHGASSTLQFFLGDCLEVIPRLDTSIDVVVTSPPYNLGVAYRSYDDRRPRKDYLTWTGRWVEAVGRVLTIQDRDKDRPHPATFPPRLPEFCLRLHGVARSRLAADPFLGLGSTAVAAASLDVNFVGIEMDEGYLTEGIARTRSALERARSSGRRRRSAT